MVIITRNCCVRPLYRVQKKIPQCTWVQCILLTRMKRTQDLLHNEIKLFREYTGQQTLHIATLTVQTLMQLSSSLHIP